jgi:hypothetical protein
MSDIIACPDPTCQAPARIVDSLRPLAERADRAPVAAGLGRS